MEKLVIALGPAFAAGFALQQLLEILDPFLDKIDKIKTNKKLFLGIVSLFIGMGLSFGAGLQVLQPLGVTNAGFWDMIITGLIISAGTEGFNSITKFMGHTKEQSEADAKKKQVEAANTLKETTPEIRAQVEEK